MRSFTVIVFLLLVVAAGVYYFMFYKEQKEEEIAAGDQETSAPAKIPDQPAAPAAPASANVQPASAPAAVPAAPAAAGEAIGVAECDEYLTKYTACIEGKVPAEARAGLKTAMDAQRGAWKQAASTPEGKAALAAGCKAALEAAKTAMGAYGCAW